MDHPSTSTIYVLLLHFVIRLRLETFTADVADTSLFSASLDFKEFEVLLFSRPAAIFDLKLEDTDRPEKS